MTAQRGIRIETSNSPARLLANARVSVMRKGHILSRVDRHVRGRGEHDELLHDGGYGDFGGLSGIDELLIDRAAILVESASDERWHVKSGPLLWMARPY